jgi:phage/plasmid primase-like uncharacterized protein
MSDRRTTTEQIERARAVRIENELERRGIRLPGKLDRVGPCPKCGGTDRFSINTKLQVWNCRGCKPTNIAGNVIGLVQWLDGRSFVEAVELLADDTQSRPVVDAHEQRDRDDVDDDIAARIASALRWWREAGPIHGTAGATYFERERGIAALPPDVHEVLRLHPRCIWGKDAGGGWQFRSCILALYRDVLTNAPTGVHRIALDDGGKLIGRKALGRKQGSAVKLWADDAVATGLVVGEGLESVLAGAWVEHQGTLLQPAWALIDAGNLAAFPVLPGVESITILADADERDQRGRQAGQEAARACARRWAEADREAVILMPDQVGEDFNDIARQATA